MTTSMCILTSAWTAAAVDTKRIIGVIPIVMDLLNLQMVNPFEDSIS